MAKPTTIKFCSNIFGILTVFVSSCVGLYLVAWSFTNQVGNSVELRFPHDLEDLKLLIRDLRAVRDGHWFSLLSTFSAAYLFKQTFAIPGSVLMNILGGAIFGMWVGLPLVCVLAATGATLCFTLSWLFGHTIVHHYLEEKIAPLKRIVAEREDASEFLILVSLRLFPSTPNWLLNLAAPHLGVNTLKFFLSVFLGLLPYNFLCVQAGALLHLTSLSSIMDAKTTACLVIVSVGIILMVWYLRRRNG